jgi:hypothetical protein
VILLVLLRLAFFFSLHFDVLARHLLYVIFITFNVPTCQQLHESAWIRLGSLQGLGFKVNSQLLIQRDVHEKLKCKIQVAIITLCFSTVNLRQGDVCSSRRLLHPEPIHHEFVALNGYQIWRKT